ncbi:putative nucleic acid-binding protein [Erysiphe necator]|uniref:Putative nucleic acid-binding protein n=1 Tax=Uncinula necator TaxID=52586 RepID=A0A0B1P7N0_UNCNE|nr:putative nucleic acid-binding protein [Erysiphe necator]
MFEQKLNEKVQLSIKSFYKREVQTEQQTSSHILCTKVGDGFTEAELVNSLDPLRRNWDPDRNYIRLSINQIRAGPKHISFSGRIVNMKTYFGVCTQQQKANGWHYLIIKDDTGAIFVGLFVTLWTAFISETLHGHIHGQQERQHQFLTRTKNIINVNMFPGRVASDHILIQHETDSSDSRKSSCRPFEYKIKHDLHLLVPLDSYLNSGYDVKGIKILVVVKNITSSRKIKRKNGDEVDEVTNVGLMDNTAECSLTLWNDLIPSAHSWHPKETILLITDPGFNHQCSTTNQNRGSLQILQNTMIEIDPTFENALWLRQWAKRKARQEAVTWESTENKWKFESSFCGETLRIFTLAELDNRVRSGWSYSFSGFINIIIRNMNIYRLHLRNKLMCGQCCGNLLFSNESVLECGVCGKLISLLPNASVVGQLLDETGCIDGGSLQWSPSAWENLFGRPVEAIANLSANDCDTFEQRLCFLRIYLHVGWREAHVTSDKTTKIAKLSVLGVHM